MSDLFKRTISGIVGIVILVYVVTVGNYLLSTSIFILSLIGLKELFDSFKNINLKVIEYFAYISALGIYITNLSDAITLDFIIVISIMLILPSLIYKKEITITEIAITVLSVMYIPYMFNHINYLNGTKYIWLIFIIAFGTDTFAYVTGNLIGRKKLCPDISPNKTIEGFVGGIFGSVVCGTLYSHFVGINPIWKIVILTIIASIAAQIGDLVASKIKRITKIKDFGFIMPGHGGVLDRFDSIIFSSPLIYYYIKYFLIH